MWAASVGAEVIGRAHQAGLLGPRFGFAVGDADHDDLIIRQQWRVGTYGFVKGEDVEFAKAQGTLL